MFKSGDLATIYKMFQKEHHHFAPDKIISVGDISIQQLRKRKGEGIPLKMFPELQKMTHGPRKGELWTLTGPSGSGKSTISRKIEYAIAEYLMDEGETIPRLDGWTPEEKMCIIRLEEEEEETLNSLYAEGLGIDPKGFAANPEEFLTEEEHNTIHQYYIKKDKIKIFDHFGSIPTKQLIAKLKQMVFLYGCRWIILDHLSMVVSGLESDNERKDLDIIMTELAAFCVQYDVFVLSICHIRRVQVEPPKDKKGNQKPFFQPVRKENLRGSAAIEQLSWVVLAVEPEELPDRSRGRIRLVSLKNRPWKILGVADTMMMDKNGQFHDASRWEWKEEEGCFECDGEVVYKMPGATINLDPDDLEEPEPEPTQQPTIVNEDDDMDGSPF